MERGPGRGASDAGAPPLLLLHGFTGSAAAWGERALAPLARGRALLVPDLPGHGASPAPRDPARYRVERVVEDLVRLLDELGIERADWAGYSMGGRIAVAAAVLRADRVARLVLESGSPGLAEAGARARRRTADEELARRLETRGIEWFVEHWTGLPLFASRRHLAPAVRREARRRRLANDPLALAAVLRGSGTGAQPSWWDALPRIRNPVLLVTGELDSKFVAIAERMRGLLPAAIHRSIPGAGHTVHLEKPGEWAAAVDAFLERGGARGP